MRYGKPRKRAEWSTNMDGVQNVSKKLAVWTTPMDNMDGAREGYRTWRTSLYQRKNESLPAKKRVESAKKRVQRENNSSLATTAATRMTMKIQRVRNVILASEKPKRHYGERKTGNVIIARGTPVCATTFVPKRTGCSVESPRDIASPQLPRSE